MAIIKITKTKIKKQYIFFILAAIILVLIFSSGNFKKVEKPEKPVPSVSIGCDRVIWKDNDFAFMGDKAKREFSDQYNADIKPGETYEIPIQMTIPEKVSGVRPAGRYTITVNILLGDKTVNMKIVNT